MGSAPPGSLAIRRVTKGDAVRLFQWANDPVTRSNSFDDRQIEWEEHVAWLEARLADPSCLFYIALEGEEPIGQVRFALGEPADEGEPAAVVSASIASEHRSRGLAAQVIHWATREAVQIGVGLVYAFVKPANVASLRAFERAGYVESKAVERQGEPVLRLAFRVRGDPRS